MKIAHASKSKVATGVDKMTSLHPGKGRVGIGLDLETEVNPEM
jgi:hypothetical protein